MKKLLSVLLATVFALTVSGFALAADNAATAPEGKVEKTEKKEEKKKTTKKGTKTKKKTEKKEEVKEEGGVKSKTVEKKEEVKEAPAPAKK